MFQAFFFGDDVHFGEEKQVLRFAQDDKQKFRGWEFRDWEFRD
jgi:hypothetical protein